MRYQVLVDSRDRNFDTFPQPNTYRVRLPRRFTNVVGARVLSADIPLSFLVFKAEHGNTSLTVTVGGSGPQTVTIRDGNYDDQSMVEELRASLAAAFPGKDFLAEVDTRTYQLVLTCVQGDAVGVDTTAANEAQRTDWGLAYYLGFPKGAVTSGAPLRAPGTVNLNPFTYVLMDIEELGVIDEGGMYGSTVGRGCFCKIPIQGVSYEYIFRDLEKATDIVPTRALVPRLDTLTITFRLHDNRVIDFRGVEHSFLLEIETRDRQADQPSRLPPDLGAPTAVRRKTARVPRKAPPPPKIHLRLPPRQPPAPPRRVPRSVYLAGGVTAAGLAWWWWRRSQQ